MSLSDNNFYIYGAGLFGLALCEHMLYIGIKPRAVIDLNPPKGNHLGVDILAFESNHFDYSIPIAVSILGYDGVRTSLVAKGFKHIIETVELFKTYPEALAITNQCGFLWMQKPIACQVDTKQLARFKSLLSDQRSKTTLEKITAFRQSPSADNYPWPENYEMYFPEDIPELYNLDEFYILDVGAFDGDTLDGFYRRWPEKIQSYIAIDVSPENIDLLEKRIKSLALPEDKYRIVCGAVGVDKNKHLILRGENSATHVTEINRNELKASDILVKSHTLSTIIDNDKCNIIKMDIEGADYAALEQASDLIKIRKPTLALSIYHAPEDLWQIPLLIDNISPNTYNFYLRQEGHWGLETILYAIPK